MKVVILGAGRRGIKLARRLAEENRDIIVLDEDPNAVEKAMQSIDCLGLVCTATNTDELEKTGIKDADAFIALTGSDETNLVSCAIVSSLFKIPTTIATVKNISYTKTENLTGISHIVNPYQEVASHIKNEIEQGIFSDIISFENSKLIMYNIYVDKKSKFAGKVLKEVRNIVKSQFIVAALSRKDKAVVPSGDTVIQEGDTLSVVIQSENIEELMKVAGHRKTTLNRIAIAGSTNVTDFLLKELSKKARRHVMVIAKDRNACIELSEKYPDTLIINDNIASEGLFKRESIENYDLFIGATDNDELNIISASYAKNTGVRSSLALLTKTPDYIIMSQHLGIDSVVSSQDITADAIAKYLHGTNIASMHSIFDGAIEVFEYKVPEESPLRSKMLKEINMRNKGIIAGVYKTTDNKSIIPSGTYVIETGDILTLAVERRSLELVRQLLGISQEE